MTQRPGTCSRATGREDDPPGPGGVRDNSCCGPDPAVAGGHPGDNNRPPLAAAATSHPVTVPSRPAPANRCRAAVSNSPIAATASVIPGPAGPGGRHVHPGPDGQPGEEHPHLLRPGGEPPQPAPDRARRHPQPDRDPPVPQPQGRLRRQRRADHRHRVRPSEQAKHRQQHVRRPAPRTPRPPRPDPHTTAGSPHRPDPGMTPRHQTTPASGAGERTRSQVGFHNRSRRRYRLHRCLRAPSHGPPATCLPGPAGAGGPLPYQSLCTLTTQTSRIKSAADRPRPSAPSTTDPYPHVRAPRDG